MTHVADDTLGRFARQQHDLFERVRKGSLDPEKAQAILRFTQDVVDGKFPDFPGLVQGTHEISRVRHFVDLSAPPALPFKGAEVVKHVGAGIVELELRDDDNLYINLEDGKGFQKIIRYLSVLQMGDPVSGHEFCAELEKRTMLPLNSNVLDYLLDHPELVPEHWKLEDGDVPPPSICFFGSIFRRKNPEVVDEPCVRYGSWYPRPEQDYVSLDRPLEDDMRSAVAA